MKIKNNKLEGIPFKPTPNQGGIISPKYIVIHYDAATNATSAISWMTNPASKVSAHIHISRDAVVTQLVDFNRKAWHAGVSSWKGLSGLNDHSIGIELQNDGKQDYTDAQIKKAIEVCQALVSNYPIKEIIGHSDIAPKRKADPGPKFPWDKFKGITKS